MKAFPVRGPTTRVIVAPEGVSRALARIDELRSKIRALVGQAHPGQGVAATGAGAQESSAPEGAFRSALAAATAGESLSFAPEPIRSMLQGAARRHGVPFPMLESVARRESAFNARAVSAKGAQGLMQIMPGTQSIVGVTDPFDPGQSIEGGARYLRMMLDRFGGDPRRALAAYNAGPGAVERYHGVPPFPETQSYVRRILDDMALYESGSDE